MVESATSLPLAMMSTRLQVIWTSARLWVERMTVRSSPMSLMRSRISAAWFGSRPDIGSSRISTGGSCRIAWAMPTRCR